MGCQALRSPQEEFPRGTKDFLWTLPKLQGIGKLDFGQITPLSGLTLSGRSLSPCLVLSVSPAGLGLLEARLGILTLLSISSGCSVNVLE